MQRETKQIRTTKVFFHLPDKVTGSSCSCASTRAPRSSSSSRSSPCQPRLMVTQHFHITWPPRGPCCIALAPFLLTPVLQARVASARTLHQLFHTRSTTNRFFIATILVDIDTVTPDRNTNIDFRNLENTRRKKNR